MFVCTICQDLVTERPEGFPEGEEVHIMALICGHVLHRSCILKWFQKDGNKETKNGSCPVCQKQVKISESCRIYPSEDEESNAVTAKLKRVKDSDEENAELQEELEEIKAILASTANELEAEQAAKYDLEFKYATRESEIDSLNQKLNEKQKLLENFEVMEKNWKKIVAKSEKEARIAEERYFKQVQDINKKYTEQVASNKSVTTRSGKKLEFMKKSEEIELGRKINRNLNKNLCQPDEMDGAQTQLQDCSISSNPIHHMESESEVVCLGEWIHDKNAAVMCAEPNLPVP